MNVNQIIAINPRPGSARSSLIALLVVAFLAFQFIVPASRLFAPPPARFSWQMYASLGQLPTFAIVTADGSSTPIDLNDQVGYVRLELDYLGTIPTHLCATNAEAVAIRVLPAGATEAIDYPCP